MNGYCWRLGKTHGNTQTFTTFNNFFECEWMMLSMRTLSFFLIWSHAATSRRRMDTEIRGVSVRFSAKSLKSPATSAGSEFLLSCNFNCSNDTSGASATSVDAPIFPTNFHSDIWSRGNMLVNIFHWSTGWFRFCPEHWTTILVAGYIDGTCQLSSVNHMGTYLKSWLAFLDWKLYIKGYRSPDKSTNKHIHTHTHNIYIYMYIYIYRLY